MSARCQNSSVLLNKGLLVLVLLSSVGMAWADPNSCSGRCNNKYRRMLPCHCNLKCIEKDNCCNDFEDVCELSCENRCFLEYNRSRVCQCNAACHNYTNCCPDFNVACQDRTTSGDEEKTTMSIASSTSSDQLPSETKSSKSNDPQYSVIAAAVVSVVLVLVLLVGGCFCWRRKRMVQTSSIQATASDYTSIQNNITPAESKNMM